MKVVRTTALATIFAAIFTAPALAQTMTPTVDNGGLIPPFLVIWLLAAAGIISAIGFVVTDRALRSR